MGIEKADAVVNVVLVSAAGEVYTSVDGETVAVFAGESKTVSYELTVPEDLEEGMYIVRAEGWYQWNGENITIVAVEEIDIEKTINVTLTPLFRIGTAGENVPFEVKLQNIGASAAEVTLTFKLFDPKGNVVWQLTVGPIRVEAGETSTVEYLVELPENLPAGEYLLTAEGEYAWNGWTIPITKTQSTLEVTRPPEVLKILGIPLGLLLAMVVGLAAAGTTGYFAHRYYRKRLAARRRFEARLFLEELPKAGPDTVRFGMLAETKQDAFLGLNDLRMHMMTAGATGGGKTISSMVIAEEALLRGKNVIVFDPTAQWTGFLRKCTDKKMLSHYPKFGMKETQARAFPGVVKLITNPREKIDMKELLSEAARGKITVFVIERLRPGDADVFVTNVIQSVFESQPMEYPELRTLIIFDEVHRLLPRFGGTGAGVIQLERACREFRKWGIGMLLISQIMGDFEEEIRTNIRTQVQFWTREGSELERITRTYGEEHMRSVSKAPVGFGMVVNPDYNRGRPYYVNFRPILHAVRRLTPEELDRYYQADDRVEEIKYKLKRLEEKGVDVFDLRIELGLATRKLEEAAFDMVAAYLDSLEPRVEDVCARHGLKGIKREIELRPEKEIKSAQLAAIKEREARLAKLKRPPEIVEAYKELLAPKKEVVHAPEVEKPLKEEEEMLHPEARKELERKRREEMRKKKAEKKEEEEKAPAEAGRAEGEMIHPEAEREEAAERVEIEKVAKPEKIEIGKVEKKKVKETPKGKKATNGGIPRSAGKGNSKNSARKVRKIGKCKKEAGVGRPEKKGRTTKKARKRFGKSNPGRKVQKGRRETNGGMPLNERRKSSGGRGEKKEGYWLDRRTATNIYEWLEGECG
jgi:hypothetical protein